MYLRNNFVQHTLYEVIRCASVYGNEKQIGKAIKELIAEGVVTRNELWITSKVWNDMHGEGNVIKSCKQSLADLQLDYLDLYLVHWPFPNYHAPGCDGDSRNPDSIPYSHKSYMTAWRQMEQLCKEGLVKNIGTSNMTIPKFRNNFVQHTLYEVIRLQVWDFSKAPKRSAKGDKVAVTAISTEGTITLMQNKTKELTVKFTPVNASNKAIVWSSSNTSVATVDKYGVVTAVAASGTAVISAKSVDGNYTSTTQVTAATYAPVAVTGVEILEGNSITVPYFTNTSYNFV